MYSYHIFYFPFKWELPGLTSELFSKQVDLKKIVCQVSGNWEAGNAMDNDQEAEDLYNEKNYYYEFVHPVLYDENKPDTIIKHFERKEPKSSDVYYKIKKKGGKEYSLRVESINLNFYSTGIGTLSFYLLNDLEYQKSLQDILDINQYGRRILPPFIADIDFVKGRSEIAEYIEIEGLNNDNALYWEDFEGYTSADVWKPACFIRQLINDLGTELNISPVIDDRMFVACWYGNNALSREVSEIQPGKEFWESDEWYKYVFIDQNSPSCQNLEMKKRLLNQTTYKRWQNYGTLYGVSRYSLVALTDESDFSKKCLAVYLRTIYARMAELILVQRGSMLRFSGEVSRLSRLSETDSVKLARQISSLYKEYIRFVNQIYFREVTAQEQGIELYDLLHTNLKINDNIKDLNGEIEELHQYFSLIVEGHRSNQAATLNKLATIFLPATIITGIWGMNRSSEVFGDIGFIIPLVLILLGIGVTLYYFIYKKR